MPNHLPQAIANEFLRRRQASTWPAQMYVQKLAYIAHGWNLAVNREPLISVAPEAWDNGPVYRDIWDHVRDYGYRGAQFQLVDMRTDQPFHADLTPDENGVIEHVWRKYGGKSAADLSRLTHEPGTPWFKAYARARNAPLLDRDIHEHYVELALAGREQGR